MWSSASTLPWLPNIWILLLPHFRSAFIRKDVNLRFRTSHLCMDFQKCEVSLPHFHSVLTAKDLKFCFFHTSALPLFAKMWVYDSAQLISAWSSKDVKFRFRISTLPWLPKIWSPRFPYFHHAFIRKDVKLCLHTSALPWLPKFCSLGSAVYSYMYFHTISCCLTWRISPSERRSILIRTQKSKPSSNWLVQSLVKCGSCHCIFRLSRYFYHYLVGKWL